jgi:ribonuclease Y
MMTQFFILIAGLLAGGALAWKLTPSSTNLDAKALEKQMEEAKQEAQRIKEDTAEKVARLKRAFLEDEKAAELSLKNLEELTSQKEDLVARREQRNQSYEKNVQDLEKDLNDLQEKGHEIRQRKIEVLSKTSKLSAEDALKQVREELHELITEGKDARKNAELEEFQEELPKHAKAVLQIVIQRLAVPSSVDKNTTLIRIADERFKGMLVGKQGSNLLYFEELLPISLIFNHGGDPGLINVAGLNLIRRNIAKRAIKRLEKNAKKIQAIDHKMIKEAVEASEKEIMEECDRWGAWAMKQMGIDPVGIDAELLNYTGRLYFRTSSGQNIIHHSLEMAYAARLVAELIGTDPNIAMQGAFYHDIGKAIDHDIGGAHDDISKEILEKHGYDPAIVHAAFAHHDKVPCEDPADFIVKAVDAISGGRPGARMESVTNYFERMQQLEGVAKSFQGVGKVFTMSAGREVRVLVNKDQIQDGSMGSLADQIAEKISAEVAFPGIIKVNLIRQTKSIDYAREIKKHH